MDHRNALNNNALTVFGKEVASDNVKALLVYAIGATVFTVCASVTFHSRLYLIATESNIFLQFNNT